MGRRPNPTIQTYRHTDGTTTYRIRVRVGGRQTTETFHSHAAAEVFRLRCIDPDIGPERAVNMRAREDRADHAYIPTIRELLETHVAELTGVDDRTRDDYLAIARRNWLPRLGPLRADEITRADIASWINQAAGTMAPKTLRNAHSVLSAVLNTAVDQGHLPANPARGIRLPRAGEEDVEDMKLLTHAEFDLLFAEIPEPAEPLVIWMFGMGTRWSETTAVQATDINLEAGQYVGDLWESTPTTRIVRAWKKGNRIGPPKSKAGRRTIWMPDQVVEAIEPLIIPGRDPWLFRTTTGKPVRHGNFFNRVWKPATMRASICPAHRLEGCKCFGGKPYLCTIHTAKDDRGDRILPEPCGCAGTLPFRPRIHDARHTHASWLIAQGVRLDVVQHRLGHEDYLTTMRLYGHLLPDAQQQAAVAASLAFANTKLQLRDSGPTTPLELGG